MHENLKHVGRNHVLSKARERFWVISGNSDVRRILSQCVTCKPLREPVKEQKMAELPEDRVNPAPPFSHVGVYFFGPYVIKEGRK